MPSAWAFYVLFCLTCGSGPSTTPALDFRRIDNLSRDACLQLANEAMARHRVTPLPIDGIVCRNKETGAAMLFDLSK